MKENFKKLLMAGIVLLFVCVCVRAKDRKGENVVFKERFVAAEKLYKKSLRRMRKKRWKEAEAMIERIMQAYPSFKEATEKSAQGKKIQPVRYALALAKFKQGKYREADTLVTGLDDADSLYLKGRCLEADGEYLKAITTYRDIFVLPRTIPDEVLEYRIAMNFLLSHNGFSAEDSFRAFLEKYPESPLKPYATYHVGSACFLNRKYGIAENFFKDLLDQDISLEMNTRSNFMLGECKFYLTDYLFAEQHYLDVILSPQKDNPWVAQAFYRRTWCAYKLRNVSDFMNMSGKFRKMFPKHTLLRPILYLIGYSFTDDSQLKKAIKIFRHILDQEVYDELWDAALNQMAGCYTALNDYGSIITVCQHLLRKSGIKKTPWKPGILLYLGEAYYNEGFIDKAKNVYQQILDDYPLFDEQVEAARGFAWCLYKQEDDDAAQGLYHTLAFPKDKSRVSEDIQAESLWQIGNCLSNKGKYNEAVALYDSVAGNFPESVFVVKALNQKAEALFQSDYYTLAIKTWQELVSRAPDDPLAQESSMRIASTYFLLQDFNKASRSYATILKEYPGIDIREDITLRLAQSFYNAKDYENAMDVYNTFISSYPSSFRTDDALNGKEMAEYMYAIENNDPVKLAAFAKNNPHGKLAPDALIRIGQIHFEQEAFHKAIDAFQNVFTAYPESESAMSAYYMLARIYHDKGDFAMEEQTEQSFLSNFPDSELAPEVTFNLGLALCQQENYADAVGVFKRVFEYKDQKEFAAAAQYNLALCYKKLNKWDEATNAYRVMLADYSDFKQINAVRSDLAILLTEQGLNEEAIEIYKTMVRKERGEKRLEVMYKLADCYLNMQKNKQAMNMLNRIFRSGPRASSWRLAGMVKLGELYEKEQNWDKAVNVYKEIAMVSGANALGRAAKSKLEILVKLKNK